MGAAFSAVPDQKKATAQSPLMGATARLMPIRLTVAETKEQKETREKEEKEQEAKLKKLGM
jgi:hypothetical protein